METELRLPTLQRLVRSFVDSCQELGASVAPLLAEGWAVLVHESMSGRGRQYHTVEHVFDIGENTSAQAQLAILFHDTVYVQADGGLVGPLALRLGDAVTQGLEGVEVAEFDKDKDPTLAMVVTVFGLQAGQTLSPFTGLNEFLSALLAARELSSHLEPARVAEITACIEATIPFRGENEDGTGPLELLYEQLTATNDVFELGMTEAEIEQAVRRAADVANRDVANFGINDPHAFLDNTWKLLPETNDALRGEPLYTVSDYRIALGKMFGFLGFLKPDIVFRGFRGTPSAAELEGLTARAARNIDVGLRYLRAKLLAAHTLESIALCSGGNAPIALFMGDLPGGAHETIRLESELPAPDATTPVADSADPLILGLLEHGRAS
ncbi:MAG: hypothetical protein ACYTFT_07420, partial [Planctomycetota bacterium]